MMRVPIVSQRALKYVARDRETTTNYQFNVHAMQTMFDRDILEPVLCRSVDKSLPRFDVSSSILSGFSPSILNSHQFGASVQYISVGLLKTPLTFARVRRFYASLSGCIQEAT